MRIVGGRLRSRPIAGPKGPGLRPTADRLRESLFNILAHAYGDPVAFSRRSFSAEPSGRELDLRLGMTRTWGRSDLLQLQLVGVEDQGNVAGAPLALGVLANWRTRF